MYQFCWCWISPLDQQSSVWSTELRSHGWESAVWFLTHYGCWFSPDKGSEQIKVTTNKNWHCLKWNNISHSCRGIMNPLCHRKCTWNYSLHSLDSDYAESHAVADLGAYVTQPPSIVANKTCSWGKAEKKQKQKLKGCWQGSHQAFLLQNLSMVSISWNEIITS